MPCIMRFLLFISQLLLATGAYSAPTAPSPASSIPSSASSAPGPATSAPDPASSAPSTPTPPKAGKGDECRILDEQLRAAGSRPAAKGRKSNFKGIFKRQASDQEAPRVPGQVAQDCLNSIPFDANKSRTFIQELRKYIDFQSTLEILKAPPETYASGPVDIVQGLDKIAAQDYKSLHAFNVDLKNLVTSAHDGHFNIRPCTAGILSFERDHPGIVSVSQDGLAAPKIYAMSELEKLKQPNASVSDIVEINGKDALKFLEEASEDSNSQDPDARWNELFFSKAWDAGKTLPLSGAFVDSGGAWPGANTTIKFRNGTSVDVQTLASPRDDKSVESTDKILENYCKPEPPPPPPPFKAEEGGVPGYPEPVARDPLNQITGYFLDNETAVLAVSGFGGEGEPEDYGATWSSVALDLINQAKESGRDKIIIDASGNGGGDPIRFLNMFQVFFPDKFPFDALRFRRNPAIDAMTKAFGMLGQEELASAPSGLGFRAMIKPNQEKGFNAAQDILGKEQENGAPVSAVYTLNFTLAASEKDPIEGFNPKNVTFPTQPFKTENMVVMGNGFCHSSCAGFVNIMANVGKVKTLAFGGRPAARPMQIMGGVRGGSILDLGAISDLVGESLDIIDEATGASNQTRAGRRTGASKRVGAGKRVGTGKKARASEIPGAGNQTVLFTPQELERANASMPAPIQSLPYKVDGSVNFENTYLEADVSKPLQFEFQAADCRLYYTAENILDPKSSWAAAKEATWGGGKCVEGSQDAAKKQPDSPGKPADGQKSAAPGCRKRGGNTTRSLQPNE